MVENQQIGNWEFRIRILSSVLLTITQKKYFSHYSKSQIFVQKFNFDKTQTFSRVFHPIFLTIFLVKSKLSTAKKSKTTTFSRVFHPKKNRQFSWEINLEFLDKKEDFEQCDFFKTYGEFSRDLRRRLGSCSGSCEICLTYLTGPRLALPVLLLCSNSIISSGSLVIADMR